MEIVKESIAGTLESSDVMVRIIPAERNEITINSSVKKLFGKDILDTVNEVLETFDIHNAHLIIEDKGALDIILRARLIAAIYRGSNDKPDWNKIL